MLTIEYEPNGVDCLIPVTDGNLISEAQRLWRIYLNCKENLSNIQVRTGQESLIYAFKLLVSRKEIPFSEIEFEFQGIKMTLNKYATNSSWSKGFCDIVPGFAEEILINAIKMRKEE